MLFSSCEDNQKSIKYTIKCNSCDLTYENKSGGTEQIDDASYNWSYSFTGEVGQFVYISAQNNNNSGIVTVNISVDGEIYKTSTSTGAYVIATASGSIPD